VTTAEAIKKLRGKLGVTQRSLAEKLKVTVISVSRWENGREPSQAALKQLAKIAESIGIDYLRDIFAAKRRADIITGVERLPSAGSPRRVPFRELSAWYILLKNVKEAHKIAKGSEDPKERTAAIESADSIVDQIHEDLANYIGGWGPFQNEPLPTGLLTDENALPWSYVMARLKGPLANNPGDKSSGKKKRSRASSAR
jgi:transcriptional regulator with XRE-family HTH domain